MTKYLVEEQTLTDIADSIREQTGDSNPIMLSNFASAISGISGGSHAYSTTEHEVGTWIDGATLYEKTIPATWSASNNVIALDFTPDIIFFVLGGSYKKDPNNNIAHLGYYVSESNNTRAYYRKSDNSIVCQAVGANYTGTGFLTIQYTKASASLLSMNNAQSEGSERSENE